MSETKVPVDDATINVVSEGSGDAIVLLHGFPYTQKLWDVQAKMLAQTYRVVRPDLRGMGESSVPSGPYLMETLAGDLAATLDALALERVSIVGHSLGGYVALAFCRMFAERVSRLILVCSRLAADTPATARGREALADRIEVEGIQPAIDAYLPRQFAPGIEKRNAQAVATARSLMEGLDPLGTASMLRGMAARVSSEDIAEDLMMPVTVIAGVADVVVPLKESEAIAGAFSDGRLERMEQSAHVPMLEEPEHFAARLIAALAAH
ncbi:MAG: alpha/beta hydrolase [Candidatus Baltobacteraceae bacterium]